MSTIYDERINEVERQLANLILQYQYVSASSGQKEPLASMLTSEINGMCLALRIIYTNGGTVDFDLAWARKTITEKGLPFAPMNTFRITGYSIEQMMDLSI